ncbi:hypothetical protein NMY22_g11007 [Coprinellus aureogranulatus]|nr:hypothetical protein NMY22_g11007 [Coprinellus aureogranulatus]
MNDPSQPADTITEFFASYSPSFSYNPKAISPGFEFVRLCKHKGWEKDDPQREQAWKEYQDAVAKMFNATYGTDAESLDAWQNLYRTLRPKATVPDTLEAAREAVFNTHVNLMDLATVRLDPGRKIRIWDTEAQLATYTKKSKKWSQPAAQLREAS